MTTIKITDKRAIIIHDKSVALAEWKVSKRKQKDGSYITTEDWSEYLWPGSMDRAVELLAQEFVSDMELTMTMKEFKAHYQGFVEQLKAAINGE